MRQVEKDKVANLVSLSLFQLDPRVSASKKALWQSLVETALYYQTKPVSKEQLGNAIASLLWQPQLKMPNEVYTALAACETAGIVGKDEDSFYLTEAGLTHVKSKVTRAQADENAFDVGIARCLEDKLGFTIRIEQSLIIISAVKYALQEMFHINSVQIERVLQKGSYTLDEVLKAGQEYDLLEAIKAKLKPVTILLGGATDEQVLAGIKEYFQDLDQDSKRYLSLLYNKVFYHQILDFDPDLHAHQRSYFSKTRLYLDTNTLIRYLFDGDVRHTVTKELIEASKALGFQIMISPATLDEMRKVIDLARQLGSSLGEDTKITRLLSETKRGQASNPILVTFSKKKGGNRGLLWDNYITPYLQLDHLLLEQDILIETEEYENVRKDVNYQRVWNTIRRIRRSECPDRIIDHDADNLVLIHRLRQKHRPHPMGQTVWLLSWDRSLCAAERILRHIYTLPHCYLLEDWGQVILPYQNINNFAFNDYIMYLITSRLGIAIDLEGLDLDFLETLRRPEFDIDWLLGLSDSAYVAEILAGLQQNREVRKLAEQARATKAPEEITEINRQLSVHLLEKIVTDKKSSDEKAAQLSERVKELENTLHQIQTRTIWQKLRALFGFQ